MNQDRIWDYFQNESSHVFPESRQYFMLKHLERGKKVLNIGAGSGKLEEIALEKGVNIYTLDPSARTIEQLRQRLGLGDRAQAGYAQAMPFESDSFDAVVMCEVLEHLTDEILHAALRETKRILRVGGFLIASSPYKEVLENNRVICPECGSVFHRYGHMQTFDKPKMRRLIEGTGLTVEKLWVTTFVDFRKASIRGLMKGTFRLLLAKLEEPIADPHIVVKARKLR